MLQVMLDPADIMLLNGGIATCTAEVSTAKADVWHGRRFATAS